MERIHVPGPISETTGGEGVFESHKIWDSFVSDICDFLEEETGVSRKSLYHFGHVAERSRYFCVDEFDERASDDYQIELLFREYSIANMINVRADSNFCRITYSCIPEEYIKDIAEAGKEIFSLISRAEREIQSRNS